MFSSLGRIDIVIVPDEDGRARYIQTDDRLPEQIESEAALSVLFAIIRILNPKRRIEPDSPEPVVFYAATHHPPEFLRQAIRAAGAELIIGPRKLPPELADVRFPSIEEALSAMFARDVAEPYAATNSPTLAELLEAAFADLTRAVMAEYQVELNMHGLRVVERAIAKRVPAPDDEFGYWSAVLKLGAFGGELIRASNGGHWVPVDTGTLPIGLSTRMGVNGEIVTSNPLGRAVKMFANGQEDSLVVFVAFITASKERAPQVWRSMTITACDIPSESGGSPPNESFSPITPIDGRKSIGVASMIRRLLQGIGRFFDRRSRR